MSHHSGNLLMSLLALKIQTSLIILPSVLRLVCQLAFPRSFAHHNARLRLGQTQPIRPYELLWSLAISSIKEIFKYSEILSRSSSVSILGSVSSLGPCGVLRSFG